LRFRSFSFPKDITILTYVFFGAVIHRQRVRKYGYNRLLQQLEKTRGGKKADRDFVARFNKSYRASNFFLLRIFRDPNPCMIRSLVLYDLCLRSDVRAVLKTGVCRNSDGLSGHSWLEIEGKPLNEDKEFLERFTVIYEV
jgi:hypothetical protein